MYVQYLFNRGLFYILLDRQQLSSQYLSKNALRSNSIVQPQLYDICENNCYLYDDDTAVTCPSCNTPRYKTGKNGRLVPRAITQLLPISQPLGSYFQSPALRKLLEYRWSRNASGDILQDVFDGSIYRDLRSRLFTSPNDIAISIFWDGFNIFKRGAYTVTLVMGVVLNLAPKKGMCTILPE